MLPNSCRGTAWQRSQGNASGWYTLGSHSCRAGPLEQQNVARLPSLVQDQGEARGRAGHVSTGVLMAFCRALPGPGPSAPGASGVGGHRARAGVAVSVSVKAAREVPHIAPGFNSADDPHRGPQQDLGQGGLGWLRRPVAGCVARHG